MANLWVMAKLHLAGDYTDVCGTCAADSPPKHLCKWANAAWH
jgi:hypothetical protein